MIEKLDIQGVHLEVDENTHKYVIKKIGHLDKYLPRSAKDSAHVEILLKESKAKNKNHCTCEATMYLPKETINIKETTVNMYAAIDIVETKLKQKVQQYKYLHNSNKLHRRLAAKFKRQLVDNS